MPRKKNPPIGFVEKMLKLKNAGVFDSVSPNSSLDEEYANMPSLEERIKCLFNIIKNQSHPANYMLFFVMYDIRSNKVRRHVVKYLERNGCNRVQKSIFLADLPINKYNQISSDLAEVQSCYENKDSIFVVPITTDYLKAMKIIGETVNIDVMLKCTNTLFF